MRYEKEQSVRERLLHWYDQNKRTLPWRDNGDPYKIWVSEIMLQQTRVDQATPYFNRFMQHFPDVYTLAEASQQDILSIWEGLGYYSRARNMHRAAREIVEDFNGKLPDNYDEITSLKGIGPYTASAILSIAFEKSYAVVDGNVKRVLSRIYGIEDDLRLSSTDKKLQELADELLDEKRPGDFNQAVMELGAMICVPKNPKCGECPVQAYCIASQRAETDRIPYKSPAKKRPHHNIGVGIVTREGDEVLIALRPDNAMLGGLWEFPGGKQKEGEALEQTVSRELKEELGVEVEVIAPFMKLNHAYSHFTITLNAFICTLKEGEPTPRESQEVKWIKRTELDQYPFPKANRKITDKLMNDRQQQLNF